MSFLAASSIGPLRPQMMTLFPALIKAALMAKPMPELPPEIRTVLPLTCTTLFQNDRLLDKGRLEIESGVLEFWRPHAALGIVR